MDIVLTCPQCGGTVDLDEDASVFRCRYCDSVLKPTGRNEVQSFFFPPKGTKEQVGKALLSALRKKMGLVRLGAAFLVYAPYWRVRGLLFQWAFGRRYTQTLYGGTSYDNFKKLRAVSYDRTFPGFNERDWGVHSLGLRAQVLRMWPYNKERMGSEALVMRQEVPLKDAARMALQTPHPGNDDPNDKTDILTTHLIGESYTLLYFPFYALSVLRGEEEIHMLVDALSHKVVRGTLSMEDLLKGSQDQTIPMRPLEFIPFRCPNCGWDLPFRPYTRIHLCHTCGRAWQETGGSYREVAYKVCLPGAASNPKDCRYLPFWRLSLSISTPQGVLRNLKDFYRLFPLPKVMDQELLAGRPIYFYIPAFRIRNAAAVDKFAAQLTRSQPSFAEVEPQNFREVKTADVWLSLEEALEMAHVLLYSMTPKRAKQIQLRVKEAGVHLEGKALLWLPFIEKGIFLREAVTDFAIQKNCVEID